MEMEAISGEEAFTLHQLILYLQTFVILTYGAHVGGTLIIEYIADFEKSY